MADQDGPANIGAHDMKLESLSIRELREKLRCRGIDTTGCIEKSDLVLRLQESVSLSPKRSRTEVAPPACAPTEAGGTSGARATGQDANATNLNESTQDVQKLRSLKGLPVAELRRLLSCHGLEAVAAGATEKSEIAAVLENHFLQCPICLCDVEDIELSFCSCESCLTCFHLPCAARHALTAAEAGQLPLLCPVPGCRQKWPAAIVGRALNAEELERYNAAVRSVRELRRASHTQQALSPRTAEALKTCGIRRCPQCGSGIEKQQGSITHGCDKMTCRCGCRFCFVCGLEATKGGRSRCSCVGDHHVYLPHQSVMNDYADDPMRGMNFGGPFGAGFESASSPFAQFAGHGNAAGSGNVPFLPGNFQEIGAQFAAMAGGFFGQASTSSGGRPRPNTNNIDIQYL